MKRDRRLLEEYIVLASSVGKGREKVGEKRGVLQIGISDAVNAGSNEIFISLDLSLKLDLRLLDKLKPKYNMKVKATSQCFQRNYWIVVSKSKSFYWKWEPLLACQCSSMNTYNTQPCT